jgi:hypothetical protein
MFCRSFFFWPLYCLSFFNVWLLITPLVSSNFLPSIKTQLILVTMHGTVKNVVFNHYWTAELVRKDTNVNEPWQYYGGTRVSYDFSVFRVGLLCVFMFWDPCCDVRYDFLIKTMFGSSLHLVVFEGSCLVCVIVVCFLYSGVLFCQFLWIVHFWLALCYSLMVIYPFYKKFTPFKNISAFHTWYFVASITIIYLFKFVDRVMSFQNIILY